MDSIEVAVRFTEAIMARSSAARSSKGADLAQQYVEVFAEVLQQINVLMTPQPAAPPRSRTPEATSEIFPLTHER